MYKSPIGSIYHLYTTYILPIGWLYITYHLLREPETAVEVSLVNHEMSLLPECDNPTRKLPHPKNPEWSEFSHGPISQICGPKLVYNTLILSPDDPSPVNGGNLLRNKMRSMGLACLPTRTWMVDVYGKLVGIQWYQSHGSLKGRRKHVEFFKNTCHWWWVWYVNLCHFEASSKTPSFQQTCFSWTCMACKICISVYLPIWWPLSSGSWLFWIAHLVGYHRFTP